MYLWEVQIPIYRTARANGELRMENGEWRIVVFPSGMDLMIVGKGFILSAFNDSKTIQTECMNAFPTMCCYKNEFYTF